MLDDFFVDVSEKSKTGDELNDIDSLYNIVTKEELQNIYTNIDINSYLENIQKVFQVNLIYLISEAFHFL